MPNRPKPWQHLAVDCHGKHFFKESLVVSSRYCYHFLESASQSLSKNAGKKVVSSLLSYFGMVRRKPCAVGHPPVTLTVYSFGCGWRLF
jgi:hypothetical protein